MGRCGLSLCGRRRTPPTSTTAAAVKLGKLVGEVGGRFEQDRCAQPVTQFPCPTPRVRSVRAAGEPACGCATCCVVCTGCEVCAVNCLVSECPVCFCAWGAAVCHCAAEGARLPTLRVTTAVASPRTLFPTPGRLCTKRSRGFPLSSREFLDDPRTA